MSETNHTAPRILLLDNYHPEHADYLPITGMTGHEYRQVVAERYQNFNDLLFQTETEIVRIETEKATDLELNRLLPEKWDLIISTGSPFNSTDAERSDCSWIKRQIEFLRSYYHSEHPSPFLGICFGHQIFAVALGGRLAEASEYLQGNHELKINEELVIPIFRSHRSFITDLPQEAIVLAHAAEVDHRLTIPDVIEYAHPDKKVITTQSHPEKPLLANGEYNPELIQYARDLLGIAPQKNHQAKEPEFAVV
jgi:GMP synthase-like glutamine amidotransferase